MTQGPSRAADHLVPGLSLILTTVTATLIGMRSMYDFRNGQFPLTSSIDLLPYNWDWRHLHLFAGGLPFALTILAVLLAHAFGNYGACRLFGADAFPLRLFPASPLSHISGERNGIRSGINSRPAIMAIAAAGPIAGFIVALMAAGYGLVCSTAVESRTAASLVHFSAPVAIEVLRCILLPSYPNIPPMLEIVPHPVLVASWIGLLMTALNLLPAGGVDGGRIVYAISPRLHRVTSHFTIAALLYLGTVEWVGWLFWAWLLLLPPRLSPRNQATISDGEGSLGVEWLVLAPACFAILLMTATTQPVTGMSLVQVLLKVR